MTQALDLCEQQNFHFANCRGDVFLQHENWLHAEVQHQAATRNAKIVARQLVGKC